MNIPYENFLIIQIMHLTCRKDSIQSPTRKEGWHLFHHIIYTIPHDQLLFFDHRFFHSILFFILSYLLYPWWYSSFKVDLPLSEALSSVWCLWPWELQIHVYWSESWIVITCSSKQVSSFFSCSTFLTIQMNQLHG